MFQHLLKRLVPVVCGLAFAGFAASAWANDCNPIPETGFQVRSSGTNLTAKLVNPSSDATNGATVDATGCDIGIYFSPSNTAPTANSPLNGAVTNTTVFGARAAGIVNNGAKVIIDSNAVYQIGDNPFTGGQHGVAIFVYGLGSTDNAVSRATPGARGDIKNNTVWNYQKGGIMVWGGTVSVENNTVLGLGPTSVIAQSGIQFAYGTVGAIKGNRVIGNSYTGGDNISAGVLLYGGLCYYQALFDLDAPPNPGSPPVQGSTLVSGNYLESNDTGVQITNLDINCDGPVATPSKNTVTSNTIRYNGVFNTAAGPIVGDGPPGPYQAGVLAEGNKDTVKNNAICGIGYTPTSGDYLFAVDTSNGINIHAANNKCPKAASVIGGS